MRTMFLALLAGGIALSAAGGLAAERWTLDGVDRYYFTTAASAPDHHAPAAIVANNQDEVAPVMTAAAEPAAYPVVGRAPEPVYAVAAADDRWQRDLDADDRRWQARMDAQRRRDQRMMEMTRADGYPDGSDQAAVVDWHAGGDEESAPLPPEPLHPSRGPAGVDVNDPT